MSHGLWLLELESQPHLDLKVGDLVTLDVTADAAYLDPIEPSDGL